MGSSIFPRGNKVKLLQRDYHTGRCKEIKDDEKISRMIKEELEFQYHKSVLKISQCVRNLMGDKIGDNLLVISEDEGGFAKKGIVIEEEGKEYEYPQLRYVELKLDEDRVASGEMQIFSHELGHVIMGNIFSEYPKGKSSKPHISVGITDYFTAFSEGWAIHFERLAYDHIRKYREQESKGYDYKESLLNLWQCNYDSYMRIKLIKNNGYIYQKIVPDSEYSDGTIGDRIVEEHLSPVFDKFKLKNIYQMISSEGVIATIFYNISINDNLRNRYMNETIFKKFCLDIYDSREITAIFSPFENVLLKSIYVFYKIKDKLIEDSQPLLEFIKSWCEAFPEDKEDIVHIFVSITMGRSVHDGLAEVYEKNAYYGMMGDIKNFRDGMQIFEEIHTEICEELVRNVDKIYENVDKSIWVESSKVKIPKCFWYNSGSENLRVDVNAATDSELNALKEEGLI